MNLNVIQQMQVLRGVYGNEDTVTMRTLLSDRRRILGLFLCLPILLSVNCSPSAEELRERQLLHDRFVDVILNSPEKWNETRKGIAHPSLSGLYLKDAVLQGLDLSGVDLTGARIENVHFIDCNLNHLITEETIFSGVRIERSEIAVLKLRRSTVAEDSFFIDSNVRDLMVLGTGRLENVTFVNCDLSSILFSSAVIRNVTIVNSTLRGGTIALLDEVTNLVIKDSDITGLKYRAYQPGADIHIINSHPCSGPWIQFCE
ncbi:MAG: hypothetical protein CVV45_05120 [Spirochaetae bacterium HGW-Spirochaetae-10]|nr:MAG: hypothetical protein CVV45_05120 [Spirochaetae bacterium HGW-Spirochaetae-10]